MPTSDIHDVFQHIDQITNGRELLSKLPDPHNQRETLIQIGDQASKLSSLIEQMLAPWNHGAFNR